MSTSSTVVSRRPLGGVFTKSIGEQDFSVELEDRRPPPLSFAFSFENPAMRSKRVPVPLPGGSLPLPVGVAFSSKENEEVMADMSGEQLLLLTIVTGSGSL